MEDVELSREAMRVLGELTPREQEVLQTLVDNFWDIRKAGKALSIEHSTICCHRASLYQKLNVKNKMEAVLKAIHLGVVNPPKGMESLGR